MAAATQPAKLDASKVVVTLASDSKPVPPLGQLRFGEAVADHMILVSYDPVNGWAAPEIKPYGPISLLPTSSCFHYATNAWEGMKAYVGPNDEVRLFRPEANMKRLARSGERLSLPPFDADELLKLIKKLVAIDKSWVPAAPGYSLYIRPAVLGTRATLAFCVSDRALLYVICSPSGPYFETIRPLSCLASTDSVRAWPGGTGDYKIAGNYGPTLLAHTQTVASGYDQSLWLLGENITEAGFMNFFILVKGEEGALNLYTPPLDGTILPGITRDSILQLARAHPARTILPGLSPDLRLVVEERPITMTELEKWVEEGRVAETFGTGTAVIVAPIGRIGWKGKDILLPTFEGGLGPVGRALYERITAIQEGRFEWEGWSVVV